MSCFILGPLSDNKCIIFLSIHIMDLFKGGERRGGREGLWITSSSHQMPWHVTEGLQVQEGDDEEGGHITEGLQVQEVDD